MKLIDIINESIYDKILELDKWYENEMNNLKNIDNWKLWKHKSKSLQKQYFEQKNKLLKEKDPYELKGNLNSNYIYHYTNGDALIQIINDNEMIGGGDEFGGVSFTSNPNLYKRNFIFWHPSDYTEGKHFKNVGVKLKFDFNLMKQDNLKFKSGNEEIGTHAGENEHRLRQDELLNPMKYIKEIIIIKDKEINYPNLTDFLNKHKISFKLV